MDELTEFILEHDDMDVRLSASALSPGHSYVRVKVTRTARFDGFASEETSCTRWIPVKEVSEIGYRPLLDSMADILEVRGSSKEIVQMADACGYDVLLKKREPETRHDGPDEMPRRFL